MPEEKNELLDKGIVHVEEEIGLGDKVDDLEKMVKDEIDRKLTNEEKLIMINKIFSIPLNARVKNKLGEEGRVSLVGIDYRGVVYLVRYKDCKWQWESEYEISKIAGSRSTDEAGALKKPMIQTDIPDPKR